MKTLWFIAALVGSLIVPGWAQTNAPPPVLRIATPAPVFAMESVAGGTIRLADLRAPAVIVSFWLHADKPSQRQLLVLAALCEAYGTNQLQIVGVLVEPAPLSALREFVANQPLPFPVTRYNSETITGFGGLTAVPTTFVIDHNRNIIQRYVGFAGKAALESDVKIILAAHETLRGR